MSNYDSNAKGLKVCAVIWLILISLGAFGGAIAMWQLARYASDFLWGGFGIFFGGGFVAVLGYFFLSCIADLTQKSYESRANGLPTPVSKSSYAVSVESESKSFVGKCELCGKENVELKECKIVDNLGTRYRKICPDCMKERSSSNA